MRLPPGSPVPVQAVTVVESVGYQVVHMERAKGPQRTNRQSCTGGAVRIEVTDDENFLVNRQGIRQQGGGAISIEQLGGRQQLREAKVQLLHGVDTAAAVDTRQQRMNTGVGKSPGTVTNTIPITSGVGVHIYKGDESNRYDLGYSDEVSGSVIWNDHAPDTYENVESWPLVREKCAPLVLEFNVHFSVPRLPVFLKRRVALTVVL